MCTLFVVDDNEIDQLIIKLNLESYPVFKDVWYYDNGLPLIDFIKKNINNHAELPDAIFLDLSMPEFDGWHVLEELEALYASLSKKITVYILSASIRSHDIFKARSYDFVKEFISKPITKKILGAISREVKIQRYSQN